jgi:hypothetical protein
MIIFGTSGLRGLQTTEVLSDTFTGATLDSGEWTVNTSGASSAVTQDDELFCAGTADIASNASIFSATSVPTDGILTISVDWKFGTSYANTGGIGPYLAVRAASPSRYADYEFPTEGLQLVFANAAWGGVGNNTRISLRTGVASATPANMTNTTVSYASGSSYAVQWIIDWPSQNITVKVDGEIKVNKQSFTLAPEVDYFFEVGYSNYGVNGEAFDNLLITNTA